jgi:hypothetical protein
LISVRLPSRGSVCSPTGNRSLAQRYLAIGLTVLVAGYTLHTGSRSQSIVQKRLFAVPKPSRSALSCGTDPDPLLESWAWNPTKRFLQGSQELEMGNRLYVGNLPFSVDESSLRSLFEQNDRTVEEVKLITDRDTGRPRGFGFVEMANSEDADKAIQELNGYEMDGRQLNVNEARERNTGGRRF